MSLPVEKSPLFQADVTRQFGWYVDFYRSTEQALQAWRLMHGARDLPRRLIEAEDKFLKALKGVTQLMRLTDGGD